MYLPRMQTGAAPASIGRLSSPAPGAICLPGLGNVAVAIHLHREVDYYTDPVQSPSFTASPKVDRRRRLDNGEDRSGYGFVPRPTARDAAGALAGIRRPWPQAGRALVSRQDLLFSRA